MKLKSKDSSIDLEKEVFNIENEPMPNGAWWYWLWLFFFNNPKNPEIPRQLMILWSTKKEREIECNNLKLNINHSNNRNKLDGAVAAWYFDGERMHHNFLLEQCNINILENKLFSSSSIPTSFLIEKDKSIVKIGKDFEFFAKTKNEHNFTKPVHRLHKYIGNKGYSIIEIRKMHLNGQAEGKPIYGSAYFQRVFFNMPYPSWYWGIFHFDNGNILTYLNPYLFRKSIRKKITFFDGKCLHEFNNMSVKKISKENTNIFKVSGENEHEKINFNVNSYSHTSWTFRKKSFGIIPNKLVYNQYPAIISEFKLANKKNGEKIILEDLGKSVGNAEHGVGLLL
jgi:hypothetical protein